MSIRLSGVLHCYQPVRDAYDVTYISRERRWNGHIEPRNLIPQPDGTPVEDWNIKHITPECYSPLAMGGVFERLPFNFGPTLLKDLEIHAPETYKKIIESERVSFDRFGGHSNALMQASPNHAIVPLATHDDKLAHIRWALAEYQKHYNGRFPEGVWLPETAVNEETLALLADEGIKYVILAQRQAKQFRKVGETEWKETGWEGGGLDPSIPYKVHFQDEKLQGKNIAVFFYDGTLSYDVAFEKPNTKWVCDSSENFLHRWLGGRGDFKHFGVDGETFGHHLKGRANVLVGAVNIIDSQSVNWQNAVFMNYGLMLEQNPPQMEVHIHNNSSWSSDMELNRWGQTVRVVKEENGQQHVEDQYAFWGTHPNWHPYWRVQLRNAFDDLNTRLKLIYQQYAPKYFKDPRQAALDYGQVVSNARSFCDFFEIHKNKTRKTDIDAAYKLLEMQKFMKYMFTSCGWFHEYVGRIEPFTIFICANSAIRIAEEFDPNAGIEKDFLTRLSGDMINVYRRAKELNNKYSAEFNPPVQGQHAA